VSPIRVLFIAALIAVTGLAAPAFAQRPPIVPTKQKVDEAMPHFKHGVELYDESDFPSALVEFKRAYEIAQDYRVLFNVAQTDYQLQNYAGALDAFQRYLTEGGSSIARDRRTYVEKEMQRLAGRVAMVRVTVNVPNAEVFVDDEKVGTSPLEKSLMVSQGKRKISAAVSGKAPASKIIEVAGGDSAEVSLEIEQQSAPPPPPPPPPPPVETRRRVPWAPWAVTGGLFAVWGATGVIALAYSGDAQSKLNTYGVTASDIKSSQSAAGTFALVSDIALGCTVVAAGVAFVLTLLAKPEPIESKHAARVFFAPTGLAIVY
jgi:hypothetical protein